MTISTTPITKTLRQGIEAARAGKAEVAQGHLDAVLRQDRNNIPALFWSAYIAPSPSESLQRLQRILALDPANERARSGVRWAKQRLKATRVETGSGSPETKPTPPLPGTYPLEMPPDVIQARLLSKANSQKSQHKHSQTAGDENLALSPAQRTRRPVDRLLLVMFITVGTAALLTAGIWAIALTPAETLAAWLPARVESTLSGVEAALRPPVANRPVPSAEEAESLARPRHFASASDTLFFEVSEPVETAMTGKLFSTPPNFSVPIGPGATTRFVGEAPSELMAPAEGSSALISRSEAEGEFTPTLDESSARISGLPGQTNPTLNQPVGELIGPANEGLIGPANEGLIGPANEVLDGPRLFEPVDEALLAHQPTSPGEKWIEVNVTTQRVTAWEGNVPVLSFISSTGLPGTPTVLGEFNIYWKLESALMVGPDYYLPEVPYTMYFYGGYALHGTYWHDNFGQPMSHGCVNLSIDNAQRLFEWADPVLPPGQSQITSTYTNPGTLVVVHE